MTYQHSPATAAVLRSLVPVLCPAIAVPLADELVAHVGLTMGALPTLFRGGLVTGLASYDALAVLWLPGRGRRAQRLPLPLAERYFASWEHGPTPAHREFAKGVGQLVKLACYEHPTMQATLGYTPAAWVATVTKRRLAQYRDDIDRHDASIYAPDPLRPPRPRKEHA